ncbi:MAG: GNAT family N-acetyltransferase, partial [Sphingomonadales bacterium]
MTLAAPMLDGEVRIEPAGEDHREPLRTACAQDAEIWQIYPTRFFGDDFDAAFDSLLGNPRNCSFVMCDGEDLVGMSSYLSIDAPNRTLEIGRTYLAPQVRGTGFNGRVKRLMLDRAFAEGFSRVEFRVDTRNRRSMAAVAKLGAVHEGTFRKNRITWT